MIDIRVIYNKYLTLDTPRQCIINFYNDIPYISKKYCFSRGPLSSGLLRNVCW